MKKIFSRIGKVAVAIAVLLILAMLVGPFLVPVNPLEGLSTVEQVASDQSKFITIPYAGTDGIDIHYLSDEDESSAKEPTFVLLHGSNFNAYTWTEVLDFFDKKGRVIAYDQIPYGLSEKLVEGDWSGKNPYSSTGAVEQLFTLLDELGVDSAILVGNSYGGTLAVQATLANPDRIDGLILIDAAVYVSEEMPAWLMQSPQMQRIGPLFARTLGQSEAFIQQTYLNTDLLSDERMAQTLIQTQVQNWDTAYWEYLQVWGLDAPDYVAEIPTINKPALVISGDSDAIVPVADSERLNSELPNSTLTILPNCGHVPQEECPDIFENAVEAWLAEN